VFPFDLRTLKLLQIANLKHCNWHMHLGLPFRSVASAVKTANMPVFAEGVHLDSSPNLDKASTEIPPHMRYRSR